MPSEFSENESHVARGASPETGTELTRERLAQNAASLNTPWERSCEADSYKAGYAAGLKEEEWERVRKVRPTKLEAEQGKP